MVYDDLCTVTDLKKLLTLYNLTYNFEEDDLQILIDTKVDYFLSVLDLELTPTEHEDFILKLESDKIVLDNYPVTELTSITIDGKIISPIDYIVRNETGIIYFINPPNEGRVIINYKTQTPESIVKKYVIPLLKDWLLYDLNPENIGVVSSIKEGDISINYDTTNDKYIRLTNRLEELKLKLSKTRLVMI